MNEEQARAYLQTQEEIYRNLVEQLNKAKEEVSVIRAQVKRYELLLADTRQMDLLKHG